MGGGTFNPEGPAPDDRDAQIALLRAELASLASIAESYVYVQQRCARAEEMAVEAERNEALAWEEAAEARRMCDKVRMAEFAKERVVEYRRRASESARELEATQRVRDEWREAYKDLNEAAYGLGTGDIDGFELSQTRVEIMERLEKQGIS